MIPDLKDTNNKGWAMPLRGRSGVPSGTEPVSRLGLSAPAAIANLCADMLERQAKRNVRILNGEQE